MPDDIIATLEAFAQANTAAGQMSMAYLAKRVKKWMGDVEAEMEGMRARMREIESTQFDQGKRLDGAAKVVKELKANAK